MSRGFGINRPGSPEEAVAKVQEWARSQEAIIAAGKCPKCGATLLRRVDSRQAGVSQAEGIWVNYRCEKRCGWLLDSLERSEAPSRATADADISTTRNGPDGWPVRDR